MIDDYHCDDCRFEYDEFMFAADDDRDDLVDGHLNLYSWQRSPNLPNEGWGHDPRQRD